MQTWFTRRGVLGSLLGALAALFGWKQARAADAATGSTAGWTNCSRTCFSYDAFTGVSSRTVYTYDQSGRVARSETTYEYGPPTADTTWLGRGCWVQE